MNLHPRVVTTPGISIGKINKVEIIFFPFVILDSTSARTSASKNSIVTLTPVKTRVLVTDVWKISFPNVFEYLAKPIHVISAE